MKQNPNCSHFTDEEKLRPEWVTQLADAELKFTSVSVVSCAHTFCSPLLTFLGQGNQLDHFVFCPKNRLERKNGCSRQHGPLGGSCRILAVTCYCAELGELRSGMRAGSQGRLKERIWEEGGQRTHGGPGDEESVPRAPASRGSRP